MCIYISTQCICMYAPPELGFHMCTCSCPCHSMSACSRLDILSMVVCAALCSMVFNVIALQLFKPCHCLAPFVAYVTLGCAGVVSHKLCFSTFLSCDAYCRTWCLCLVDDHLRCIALWKVTSTTYNKVIHVLPNMFLTTL